MKKIFVTLLLLLALLTGSGFSKITDLSSISAGRNAIERHFRVELSVTSAIIRVPQDLPNLQDAINQVPDDGIIEVSSGTYDNSGKYFLINNIKKGFTIRAAPGANVILTGNKNHDILRYLNSDRSKGKMVFFEGLMFKDGYSNKDGVAGGLTVRYAEATFRNCTFQDNNGNQPGTGGGAIIIADKSLAYFTGTKWLNNRAKFYGAGLDIAEGSFVTVLGTEFVGNRTNYPNHHPSSSGAGIHLGNSTLYVFDSHFENNQAGYVGGAIYAAGVWKEPITIPRSKIYIDQSTFINNHVIKDPGVSQPNPTEGGAVHAEDQTLMTIKNSEFITNTSDTGGGVNLYRAEVQIYNTIFLGNQATGPVSHRAFGGSISAISNDSTNTSTNYPPARLALQNVYIQGRYGSVGTSALVAAGIYAAGDSVRQYGLNGIKQMGGLADNRAKITMNNVILYDLDVQTTPDNKPGTGTGGAMMTDLAEVNAQNVLVILSDATGSEGQGGGMLFTNQSFANLQDMTIARNTATIFGAGLFLQGSEIKLSNSRLFENEISPGVYESSNQSYGAAIFSAPSDEKNLWAIGEVKDSIFTNNRGIPVYDDDRTNLPIRINEVRYNNNQFYNNTFNDLVYANALLSSRLNAAGLNNVIITRSNGTSTDKSIVNNTQTGSPIVAGDILAIPPVIYTMHKNPVSYLGYAWSGGNATLNGNIVSGNAAVTTTSMPGTYTLQVNGISYQVQVIVIKPILFIPIVSKNSDQ